MMAPFSFLFHTITRNKNFGREVEVMYVQYVVSIFTIDESLVIIIIIIGSPSMHIVLNIFVHTIDVVFSSLRRKS